MIYVLERKKENVKIDRFEHQRDLQKIGADRRMVKIFSSQIGETSDGLDSYLRRVCRAVETSKRGVKIKDLLSFETENQKCDIDLKSGWDDKYWPLE